MYKLLVVDDNTDTRKTLCNSFPWDQVSFEIVEQADNGQEALRYILSNPVDVVLCDIRMPRMSGIELSKELHKRNSPTKIVLLSAFRDFEYAREAMSYGVRQYLIKPAKYQEIMDVFSELRDSLNREREHIPNEVCANQDSTSALLKQMDDPIISKIVNYVSLHYRTVKLEHAAIAVHMNPSYVSTYFKKATGMNFSEYVIAFKMEKAVELLHEHQWKTFEVSEMVGYANVKNFIRTFKEHFGKTPSQYRRA
ncbi:response regulator transcription factor [Paenibacillus donghaensis]|uniref:DNA-binding response regulator n=1 Tax=Paenibacillus donghaensis TaxID=414771 RepID=A0A2Z2KN80_9BACL|nr:response regulator [Paenibacillus donghaensis]ASA24059.1 DNA-binding response regulator [Paenibacillus donghaensis]